MSPPTSTGIALLALACLVRPSSGHSRGDSPDIVTPVRCDDDSFCPANTSCCPGGVGRDGFSTATACLMSWSSRVPTGPCCGDGGGCAAGYRCEAPAGSGGPLRLDARGSELEQRPHCRRNPSVHPVDSWGRPVDQSHEFAPRYVTCESFPVGVLERPHGLAIPLRTAAYNFEDNGDDFADTISSKGEDDLHIANLAYFSSSGAVSTSESPNESHSAVRTAIIGIHGSGRDASSYLCALTAAVRVEEGPVASGGLQEAETRRRMASSAGEVLVVAPWFLGEYPRSCVFFIAHCSNSICAPTWIQPRPTATRRPRARLTAMTFRGSSGTTRSPLLTPSGTAPSRSRCPLTAVGAPGRLLPRPR